MAQSGNGSVETDDTALPCAFVVDDEAQVRQFVASIVQSVGFTVHQFETSRSVEAALKMMMPHVIVLDLSLGDSDAIEVMRGLSAARFHGDLLLISGHDKATLDEVLRIGENRGLNMMVPLPKPFRVSELRERIKPLRERLAMRGGMSLETAMRNDWLEVWYQPKIEIGSRKVSGAEALVRLRHPEHGIVPPSRFLPPAGDPLYATLTDFVVDQALADWRTFADRGMKGRLAINAPASVLQRPDFVTNLRKRLPTDPDFPGLMVEITEDEAIRDPQLAREIAVQLRLFNVHVSIDDFGSGYSSLSRFQEVPFKEIKLDRSYVRGAAEDESKREMCRVVADLARRFQITSVAEGVETQEDLGVLVDTGYDLVQGYFFAKPMPGRDFEGYVERSRRGAQPAPVETSS
jgi:EAL domain-containing protein (putative c-di-GMP-specific phosphodiesterase class I)